MLTNDIVSFEQLGSDTYSKTSITVTLMAHLPWLIQTHF